MVRLQRVSREQLRERYGDAIPVSFVPTHRVDTLDGGSITWTDYVQLQHPRTHLGLAHAVTPLEKAYVVLPGGKWQSLLRGGGNLRVTPVKMDSRPPSRSGVYFIGTSTSSEIKVGWSEDIDRRLNNLQVAHVEVLKLHAWIPSTDPQVETKIHGHFNEHHVRGEWYVLPFNFIEELRKLGFTLMDCACDVG